MQEFILKYVFRAFIEFIKSAITPEQYLKVMDLMFDAAEDYIDKETALDIADPFFSALIEQLRTATGVPDND